MTTSEILMLKDFFQRELDGFATRARKAHAETKQSIETVDGKITDVQQRVQVLEVNDQVRLKSLRTIKHLLTLFIPGVPVGLLVFDRLFN